MMKNMIAILAILSTLWACAPISKEGRAAIIKILRDSELKGSIKSIESWNISKTADGSHFSNYTFVEFTDEGLMSRHIEIDFDSPPQTNIYFYTLADNQWIVSNQKNQQIGKTIFQYNEQARFLESTVESSPDGVLMRYYFNENMDISRMVYLDSNKQLLRENHHIYTNGKLMEILYVGADDDDPEYRKALEYNDKGFLVKESIYNFEGVAEVYNLYKNDDRGNIIENQVYEIGNNLISINTMQYDSKGNITNMQILDLETKEKIEIIQKLEYYER